MKADRLTRKTHLRRLELRDRTGTDLIDLNSGAAGDDDVFFVLDDLIDLAQGNTAGALLEDSIGFASAQDALLWCVRMISQSPTARMLLADAARLGWAVNLSDLKNQGFCIDADERMMFLDHFCMEPEALGKSPYFRHALLTTFIRALREIWHEERLHGFERVYAPDHILMLERVRAADCDTVTILCGWELRGDGFTELWRHLLGSEEGDMAMVFTRFLERDPGALFSGAALAYAFRQWYADTARSDCTDHDTLEALDRLLEGAETPQPFGARRLEADTLESLSILPDGKCYLAGLGDGILRDPFFAGLGDTVNQTHLFHLVYDMDVVMVNNVPFRDSRLARRVFPEGETLPPE